MSDDPAPVVLRAHRWPYLVQLAPPVCLLLGASRDSGAWTTVVLALAGLVVATVAVQWRRGGSVLDRRGMRPAGWLFRRIRWTQVVDVQARSGLRSFGQVEVTVEGRLRKVRLAGTERDDARVVREYRRAALTSR